MRPVTLKKNKEFRYFYRKGKAVHARDFTMIFAPCRYGGIRVGFSVSKKVGGAVVRNKARRRLKEAFGEILPELSGNYGIIFAARDCISGANYADLLSQMRKALKKAGIAGG